MIDNSAVEISGEGFDIELVGMSELWARGRHVALFDRPAAKPRLALAHDPDLMNVVSMKHRPDLVIAGHTHGGQVYLPFVTCRLTFACRVVRYGYGEPDARAVFVTSGTGQSMLPIRFAVPPRIDILNIKYASCGDVENSF